MEFEEPKEFEREAKKGEKTRPENNQHDGQ